MIYSRVVGNAFAPDSRKTPAIAINDGVDCVPMAKPKLFLVQLLNIAGTGPIFGPIMGAVFGPVVFLWIIFGTILGGAVHDFMVGMISSRNKGSSIAELSGIYIGKWLKWVMRGFSILLLILCGTVFLVTPANILADLTPQNLNFWFWVGLIIVYYFLATILPIAKIIGKLCPIFGILLFVMAFSVLGGLGAQGYLGKMPEFWTELTWTHPKGLPMWPCMFVTVACGAISGFHATQSPMIAKCITNEKQGRHVFYGAMVGEAVIALVWAAAGVAFYGTAQALQAAIDAGTAGGVVTEISKTVLGPFGGVLAIIGVVVCPITSGDTAFRGARLIVAEATHLDQKKIWNRLILTVPIVGAGVGLAFLDFNVLWRYFAAANQTLAMIALWISTFYLLKKNPYRHVDLITAIPATFMVAVSTTYIAMAEECCRAPAYIGYPIGGSLAIGAFIAYIVYRSVYMKKNNCYKKPLMFSYLAKRKRESRKLVTDFKIDLLLKKYYVLQKRDIDSLILRTLTTYKENYEFLQKIRIGARVEEILHLQERLEELKNSKTLKRAFFDFFNRIYTRINLFIKRRTARFMKRRPMDIGIYYQIFKYNLNFGFKHGILFSPKRDSDSFMMIFPKDVPGINYSSIKCWPLKIYALFHLKIFEIYRAKAFDDACRLHMKEEIKSSYWYSYDFYPGKEEAHKSNLIDPVCNFADKNKLLLYVDALYNSDTKILKSYRFNTLYHEIIDYAKLPHDVLLRKPLRSKK